MVKGRETYTGQHGSHTKTVPLISVGEISEDFRRRGDGDAALVTDF